MNDDPIALRKVAAQVTELQDTIKLALINNDAFTTTPDAMHKDAANAFNRHTFSDLAQYRADHAQQLQTLRSTSAVESEWAAVTHSEASIALVVNAAHTRTASLVAAPRDPATREVLGRMELHMSVNEAQAAGRTSLSPSSRALVQQVLIDDLPSIGAVRGIQHLQPASPSLYKPLSQRGFITPDMLTGDLSIGHTLSAAGIVASAVDALITAERAKPSCSRTICSAPGTSFAIMRPTTPTPGWLPIPSPSWARK